MNGSAPNSPETGSQVSVRQKLKPNFWIDSSDWRAQLEPDRDDDQNQHEPEDARADPETQVFSHGSYAALGLPLAQRLHAYVRLDLLQRGQFQLHHFRRQRRVAEAGRRTSGRR